MANRYIKMLGNGRALTRGVEERVQDRFSYQAADDDCLPIVIDWKPFLAGDTIASMSNDTTGPKVSNASHTSTTANITLSGDYGTVEHQITSTAGIKKTIYISSAGSTDRPYGSSYYDQ